MKISVWLHIFGSIKGYTTLAKTNGVSDAECSFLERFSFGQTSDTAYVESLQDKPAIICRQLPSGHWGITRVLKGPLDDSKRQTMLFITAILTADSWLNILYCDVRPLLSLRRLWRFEPGVSVSPVIIDVSSTRSFPPSEMREKVTPLLAAIEKGSRSVRTVLLVKDPKYDAETFRWLNMLLPVEHKKTFSYAVRSLSDALDVDVIGLAPLASMGNSSRRPVRFSPSEIREDATFTLMVDRIWRDKGQPPWKFIDNCLSFTTDQRSPTVTGTAPRQAVASRQRTGTPGTHLSSSVPSRVIKLFVSLIILVVVITGSYFAINSIRNKRTVTTLLDEITLFLSTNESFSDILNNLNDEIKKCRILINRTEILAESVDDQRLTDAIVQLNEWFNEASKVRSCHRVVRNLIDKYNKKNLAQNPTVYPPPGDVNDVNDLKTRFKNNLKNAERLGSSYVNTFEKAINGMEKWRKSIGKLLPPLKQRYEAVIKGKSEKDPDCYEKSTIEGHNKSITKLEDIEQDQSFVNALQSPIENHQKDSNDLKKDIEREKTSVQKKIETMKEMKIEADELCVRVRERLQDANSLSLDPNSINAISRSHNDLLKAEKLHPKNPDVPKLRKRLRSRFRKLLDHIKDAFKRHKEAKTLKKKNLDVLKDITFKGDDELEEMRKDFLIEQEVTPSQ